MGHIIEIKHLDRDGSECNHDCIEIQDGPDAYLVYALMARHLLDVKKLVAELTAEK